MRITRAGALRSAFAAARPAKPPPTMTTLGRPSDIIPLTIRSHSCSNLFGARGLVEPSDESQAAVDALNTIVPVTTGYFFRSGSGEIYTASGNWRRSLRKLFSQAGVDWRAPAPIPGYVCGGAFDGFRYTKGTCKNSGR